MNIFKILSTKLFSKKNTFVKEYSSTEVFGCPECPPQNCPTFIERSVHKRFKDAINNNNIIVVYGESRQGKTWTIEKYCPCQLRIGCTSSKDIAQLKRDMLDVLGIKVRQIEHCVTKEIKEGASTSTIVGQEMIASAGMSTNLSTARSETLKTEYTTVDLNNDNEFLNEVKQHSNGKFFIFDNFHYLPQKVQKQFCSLLKEFNYHNIKVIIVGVWKEAARITAMAPDLVNRCEHIDIGSWSSEELDLVVKEGEKALNVHIEDAEKNEIERCCANNIGIFKTFLLNLVQEYGVYTTNTDSTIMINNKQTLKKVMEKVINEMYAPLVDRVKNLALPQRNKQKSKHMRLKIVISILRLINTMPNNKIQSGISLESIKGGVDSICDECKENHIDISHITQELGVIHQREENRQTGENYIPLFYFDKVNRKLLVIEPTLYVIKNYDSRLINNLIGTIFETEKEYQNRR